MGTYRLRVAARRDAERLLDLFKKWQQARPLLRVSQCPYAQNLVLSLIEACERFTKYGGKVQNYEENVAAMYAMLTDLPPDNTPPGLRAADFYIF